MASRASLQVIQPKVGANFSAIVAQQNYALRISFSSHQTLVNRTHQPAAS
jgi:hypothetical protein